jgi:hypothetical protein
MKEYEYDFAESLGETIMEKFEALFIVLAKAHEKNPIRTIISGYDIMSIFETQRNFEALPMITRIGDLHFVGSWGSAYGKMHFQCVKSDRIGNNELLLLGEKGNSLIKFKNFVDKD